MGFLFGHDVPRRRTESWSILPKVPDDLRRRATQCRELAETCLTVEAKVVLNGRATDLNGEAEKIEEVDAATAPDRHREV